MRHLVILAAAMLPPQDAERPGQFEWAKDLDAAMELSAKDGRPVIAYFTFET